MWCLCTCGGGRGNSSQALNGLAFKRKVGIKAEGLFSDSVWVGLTRAELQFEDLEEIIAQTLGYADIHILENRPQLFFTNFVS